MLKEEKYTVLQENNTDIDVLLQMCDLAVKDDEAFKLLLLLKQSKEWGESDMIISKIHKYLKEHRNE